jgi:hypothetical protein
MLILADEITVIFLPVLGGKLNEILLLLTSLYPGYYTVRPGKNYFTGCLVDLIYNKMSHFFATLSKDSCLNPMSYFGTPTPRILPHLKFISHHTLVRRESCYT